MPVHNKFLRNELTSLGLPPDSPRDVEDRDELHVDEHVRTLTYTQIRRVIFTHPNGKTFAVEYEAPLDMGDFEVGSGPVEHHGWGRTVTALQVELRPVAVEWWMPVPMDGPDPAYQLLVQTLHPGTEYRGDDELQEDQGDKYEEVLEVISAIAGRLRDATDEGEYLAAGLIYDLADNRITVEEARADLAEITFRHV